MPSAVILVAFITTTLVAALLLALSVSAAAQPADPAPTIT